MSQLKEETQQIADNLARDKYGLEYSELPKSTQDKLWEMASELEEDLITADNRQKEN